MHHALEALIHVHAGECERRRLRVDDLKAVATAVGARKGRTPVISSYRSTPTAKRSLARRAAVARGLLGREVVGGAEDDARVRVARARPAARPASWRCRSRAARTTPPSRAASKAMNTFSGLRSRWMMPTRWAASSASSTGMRVPTAASRSKRPTRVSAAPPTRRRGTPSRSTARSRPTPASRTSTTLGWRIRLTACASWKKRWGARVLRELVVEELHRHRPPRDQVLGAKHVPHAAAADPLGEAVLASRRSAGDRRAERHRSRGQAPGVD